MPFIKNITVIGIVLLMITGCGKNPTVTPNSADVVQSSAPQTNSQTSDNAYPEPLGDSGNSALNTPSGNLDTQLVIPTPSKGKAVISGELKVDGAAGGLHIANLYLSPITSSDSSDNQSAINFSEESDPIAIQEITTGRFVFVDIAPGKYVLMIWTSMTAYPIGDNQGNTIIVTVNPGEVKDLGSITFH